jgi:hypothetical protein
MKHKPAYVILIAVLAASVSALGANIWYETTQTTTTPVSFAAANSAFAASAPLWTADVSDTDALETRFRTATWSNASWLYTTPFTGMMMIIY